MFANSFRSKEWLKVVADDPKAVKELAVTGARIYLAIEKPATCRMKTLRLRGLRCPFARTRTGSRSRLAMYAHKEDCGSLLVQINHRKSSAPCYWWLVKTNPACNGG